MVRNEDVRYRLLGQDVSAGQTFSKVGQAAKGAHDAIGLLGQSLNATGSFGPLQQGLSAISQAFQHVQEHGRSAAVVMQGVGLGLAGAGAALLAIGGQEQQAAAQLKDSIDQTGNAFATFKGQIDATVKQQATFGHSAQDTENALNRLTIATQDPTKALDLMGLAANIAAVKHLSLTDSAQLLTTALAGNTRVFRQFGINLGAGKLNAEQLNAALNTLQQRVGGQAQAQADTFSGRIKALGVEFENAVASASKFSPVLLTVGSGLTLVGAATEYLNKSRAKQLVIDSALPAAEGKVAASELAAGAAAAEASAGSVIGAGMAGNLGSFGLLSLNRGALLRGGAFAAGGLLAGSVAHSAIGGRAGSIAGDALAGAGLGAAVGSVVPILGTGLGAGIGAAGGAILGFFHHSGSSGPSASQLKQLSIAVAQANTAQDMAKFSQYLPGEFDALGNPKAAKVATATEQWAKAKERLVLAQQAYNKASVGADPLKLEAATSRLTAAEANLQKAQYLGGTARIASAQAAVDSAKAAVNAASSHHSLTAASIHLHDAKQAVTDAGRNVAAAKAGVTGLTAAQFLTRQIGNTATAAQDARDQAALAGRFGLPQQVLEGIDAADKQTPGTLHRIAITITPKIAMDLSRTQGVFNHATSQYASIGAKAFKSPAEALGKQIAKWQWDSYNKAFVSFGFTGPLTPNEFRLPPGWHPPMALPTTHVGQQAGWHPPMALPGSIFIQNQTVEANDPAAFGRKMAQQNRVRALGVGPAKATF